MHAVRTASRHPVCRIVFSPCGHWFATAQPHHGVTLHDRASGEVVRTFGNSRRPDYTSLAFLRSGAWLAAAGSKGLEVFDAATGATTGETRHWYLRGLRLACRGDAVLAGGSRSVIELGFLPHNTIGFDRLGYWHRAGVAHFELARGGEWAVGFREGGNPVAIDLTARREAHTLSHPTRLGLATPAKHLPVVTFADAAPRVAIGDGATVTVFDLHPAGAAPPDAAEVPEPRAVVRSSFALQPPDRWPAGARWHPPFTLTPDGRRLLVLRPRQRVQMWDVDGGTLAAEWSWRVEGITCLAVAPDGLTAVAGGRFGRVLTWDLE